jgi:hypothetical protein
MLPNKTFCIYHQDNINHLGMTILATSPLVQRHSLSILLRARRRESTRWDGGLRLLGDRGRVALPALYVRAFVHLGS